MKRFLISAAVLGLAACGQSGGSAQNAAPVNEASTGACALVAQPDAVFGAGAQGVASNDLPGATGSCSFASTDGLRSGDVIVYTTQSLGTTTLDAQTASLTGRWAENGVTPAAVEGLGDSAQIAVGLPGDQAQVVIRKGESLATIVATSGDAALTSEQLARDVAAQVAAGL